MDLLTPPKFLICDNHKCPERAFVLHTEFPRMLCEAFVGLDDALLEQLNLYAINNYNLPLISKKVMVDAEPEYLIVVAVYENMPPNPNTEYLSDFGEKAQKALEDMAIWYYNEIASY